MTEPQQPQPTLQIEKIYVKDVSLEIPNAPQVFMQQAQPQLVYIWSVSLPAQSRKSPVTTVSPSAKQRLCLE